MDGFLVNNCERRIFSFLTFILDISQIDLKFQEVIQLCWTADPHYRPSADMIRSLLENRLDCVTGGKLIFEISA